MTGLDGAIEVASLRAEATRRIRAGIVYGDIAPGVVHSAPALAARMGVSITPVREALLELTHRGMVTQVRNRGFRIVQRTAAELDAALELRGLVEPPMLARAGARLTPDDAGRIGAIADEGVAAAAAGDFGAFLDLDRRFHLGLLELAGNPRVVELVDQLLDQLRLAAFAPAGRQAPLVVVAEGHRAILAAMESGVGADVERAARTHLELTRSTWAGDADDASVAA